MSSQASLKTGKRNNWRQLVQAVSQYYSGPFTCSAIYFTNTFNLINWLAAADGIGVTCLFAVTAGSAVAGGIRIEYNREKDKSEIA